MKICLCLDAGPPSPADHLREVFYRMGLNDKVTLVFPFSFVHVKQDYFHFLTVKVVLFKQEIVALSGAHTLGRARPERSGWGKPETKYTVINDKI